MSIYMYVHVHIKTWITIIYFDHIKSGIKTGKTFIYSLYGEIDTYLYICIFVCIYMYTYKNTDNGNLFLSYEVWY
jgi:hypothetical protein